jgi:hypothetical protein
MTLNLVLFLQLTYYQESKISKCNKPLDHYQRLIQSPYSCLLFSFHNSSQEKQIEPQLVTSAFQNLQPESISESVSIAVVDVGILSHEESDANSKM